MKNMNRYISVALLCFIYSMSQAQAFEKKNIMLSLGLGMTSDLTAAHTSEISPLRRISITPVRPQIQFKAEFGVQRYLSVGVAVTADRRTNMLNPATHRVYSQTNIRLGTTVDFHFYQLIADKTHNPKMHPDKWDIYAGFTFGTGLSIDQSSGFRPVYQNKLYMAAHIGVRYRINEHWGISGEIGYGQTLVGFGIVYYFGGPKKSKRVIRDF